MCVEDGKRSQTSETEKGGGEQSVTQTKKVLGVSTIY